MIVLSIDKAVVGMLRGAGNVQFDNAVEWEAV
jgi:hypothetical protein